MSKNIGKNLNDKYSKNLSIMLKKSAIDALKTVSKRLIQKTEATGDLIGNKIAEKVTKNNYSCLQIIQRLIHKQKKE